MFPTLLFQNEENAWITAFYKLMKKELYLRLELTFSALKANKDSNKLPLLLTVLLTLRLVFLALVTCYHLSISA